MRGSQGLLLLLLLLSVSMLGAVVAVLLQYHKYERDANANAYANARARLQTHVGATLFGFRTHRGLSGKNASECEHTKKTAST